MMLRVQLREGAFVALAGPPEERGLVHVRRYCSGAGEEFQRSKWKKWKKWTELLGGPGAISGMLRGVLGMVLIGAAILAARALTPAGVASADAPPSVGRISI